MRCAADHDVVIPVLVAFRRISEHLAWPLFVFCVVCFLTENHLHLGSHHATVQVWCRSEVFV
jgi:hypothetical protein